MLITQIQKVLEHSVLQGFLPKLYFPTLSDLCKSRFSFYFESCMLDNDESSTSLTSCLCKDISVSPYQGGSNSRQITYVVVTGRAIPRRTEIGENDARSAISLHMGSTILWTEWVHG